MALFGSGSIHEDRRRRRRRPLRPGLAEALATTAPVALASFTFDENVAGSVVVIPRVLMKIDAAGTRFLMGDPSDLPPSAPPAVLPGGHLGDGGLKVWMRLVSDALDAIREREVEKVVLSRRLPARFEGQVPTHLVLSNLARNERGSHTFLVDGFVGSSPELLVCAQAAGNVRSISLAGSADPDDPASAGFFDTEKMSGSMLSLPIRSTPPWRFSHPSRAVGENGRHLRRHPAPVDRLRRRCRPGTTVTDLLGALHPTAAVAGTPTNRGRVDP